MIEQILETIGIKRVQENTIGEVTQSFRLPITYLSENSVFEIQPHVAADLELDTTMYPILLNGSEGFTKELIPRMHRYYTSDEEYLQDTQKLLATTESGVPDDTNSDSLREIYKSLYQDPRFIDKHNYMEWTVLEYMNHSPLYLQIIAAVQLISPALSLMMPLFFIIMPIILLLISGIPFTLQSYLTFLKNLARNHFIGKMMSSKSLGYILTMLLLYLFQVYQNCVSCRRFYNMIYATNDRLCNLRVFVEHTIARMDSMSYKISQLGSYQAFLVDLMKHRGRLQELLDTQLNTISPIGWFMTKVPYMGHILYVNYAVHNSPEFAESIDYAFGFEGWCRCIATISKQISDGKLGTAHILGETLDEDTTNSQFVEAFYPPLMNAPDCVKNNCSLADNMIVTGINASGKTTYLKTTLLNIIFTQQWGCGFYKTGVMRPYHQIHSYLNIPDTSARDSLFQAESRRCKDILDSIATGGSGVRHFCIFDELYSGTNPDEASKSAYGFLRYLAKRENVRFMLTTHYLEVCKRLQEEECEGVQYLQMEVKADDDGEDYLYTHRLGEGICEIQGGIQVLRKMGYPTELLELIGTNQSQVNE